MDRKRRIFDIIQIGSGDDRASRAFDMGLVVCVILNITMMFLDTFEELSAFFPFFKIVEVITMLLFTVEYILRIWTSDYLFPTESRGKAALHFICSFDGVVDLLTILPFLYFSGFVAFRMLRVVRILHLFRINSRYDSFNVIKSVILEKRTQLASSLFIIFILMLASSLFMYSAEHEAQPEVFRNAFSGIWWSMSTVLTVGYGDIYPVTALGKAMAVVIAFLGVGAVALPTGIISAGFVENYSEMMYSSGPEDIALQTVSIDIDSSWIGKSVHEIDRMYGLMIVIAKRGDATILPSEAYRVKMGDALVVCPHTDELEPGAGTTDIGEKQ
ncbi:MAG: ion transporter [Blautia sp.]|nr:ion transporter [Blautia sp.]